MAINKSHKNKRPIYLLAGFLAMLALVISGCSQSSPTGGQVPERPSGLAGEILWSNSIALHWSDNSASESGFVIYRGIDAGYQEIDIIEANRVDYVDSSLPTCSTVTYYVVARNPNGDSPPSNRITISLICGDGPVQSLPQQH